MSTPADLITLGIGPGGDIPSILTGGLGVAVYIAPDGIVFLHLPARSTTLHLDTRTGYQIAPYDAFTGTLWYASPTGTAGGDGSFANPYDFDTIIGASSPVQPGDTVYLRGGTYTASVAGTYGGSNVAGLGVFPVLVDGTSGSKITFRSMPGEWAIINGGMEFLTSTYTRWLNMEMTCTPATRTGTSAVAPIPALWIYTIGHEFINCYIHDYANVYPMGTGGYTMKGCICGFHGWYDGVSTNRGAAIYTHNHNGGAMTFSKNAFVAPFDMYVDVWSGSSNGIHDYSLNDNAGLFCGVNIGNASGTGSNNEMLRNFWHGNVRIQAADNANAESPEDVEFANNYCSRILNDLPIDLSPIWYTYTRKANIHHNTIIGRILPGGAPCLQYRLASGTIQSVTIDYNTYYHNNAAVFAYNYTIPGSQTLAQWQASSGYDANSTYTDGVPTANKIDVIANDDEDGRGFISVYNWLLSDSITADLSTLNITDGARCRLRNCANWDEYTDFTYDAASTTITISMLAADWTIRTPDAYDSAIAWYSNPFPNRGIFQVETLDTGTGLHLPTRSTTLEIAERS